MASAKVPVTFTPVDARKVEAALARIQAQAKGVNFGRGAESINKLSRPLGKITGQASEFQKSLEASNARVLAFGASVAVINKLSEAFGALVSNTIKVEATFAKINTILGGTQKQLEQFGNGIFKVAQQTGTSFDQVAEGALELARQGLSVEDSLSRVETALKLVRVSGIDAEKAVGGLTAAIKGFEGAGITVAQIADKLAEVDTKFAVSTEDLINGLERASASARVAGASFDELLGVVTTVQERTQRGGAVIGNAFKTIFARLGRTDTLTTLQDLGISVLDAEGNVRGAIPLFQELAAELDKLGLKSVEAGNIIQKVAGVRQRDILISLVEDLNSEQSQFAKSLQVSASAAGALDTKNSQLNQTLEALINNLTVGGQKLASVLGEIGFTDTAKDILKGLSFVVNGITDVLQGEGPGAKFAQGLIKGIGGVLTGPGFALIAAIFGKLFIDLAKFGAKSLKQVLGINKAAAQQATLQQSVLQTLLQNENIQREILALEGNKVAQEQLLLKIYNQQAAALARVQKAAATVTPGLFRGGFRGGEGGVGKTGRASGGYVAAEARDVSRGVGGAPASSKVVSIPNFAFGRGQRGTMVANTSEYIVPNFAGGGDAIFNRDMVKSMGLPAGARKINAAGGFIPNFNKFNIGGKNLSASQVASGLNRGKITQADATAAGYVKGARAKSRAEGKAKKQKNAYSFDSLGQIGVLSAFSRGGTSIANTTFGKLSSLEQGALEGIVKADIKKPSTPIRVTGIQNRSLENIDKSKVSNFRKNIDTAFAPALIDFATTLIKEVGIQNDEMSQFVQKIKSSKGNLFSTSVEGGIFESAIKLGTKKLKEISKFLDATSNDRSPFDFEETGNASASLIETFGFNKGKGKLKKADAKRSSTPDAVASLIGKSFRDGIAKKFSRSAGGYIPNFAGGALEEAIGREQAAGLPINQIKINQSGKLRNAQNPMGLAVTNTRDEPTGAIPNFAKNKSGGLSDAMDRISNASIGISTSLYFVSSALGDAESSVGKFINKLALGLSVLTGLTLLKGPLDSISSKISNFGLNLATNPEFTGRRGRAAGFVGEGISKAGGALNAAFAVTAVAATVTTLSRELTKVTNGLSGLAEGIDNVDFSKLDKDGLASFSAGVAKSASESLIRSEKQNLETEIEIPLGSDIFETYMANFKSAKDDTLFGGVAAINPLALRGDTSIDERGLAVRRAIFSGGLQGGMDEAGQRRFVGSAIAFEQFKKQGLTDKNFEEFVYESLENGKLDVTKFQSRLTEFFDSMNKKMPEGQKTKEQLQAERLAGDGSLFISSLKKDLKLAKLQGANTSGIFDLEKSKKQGVLREGIEEGSLAGQRQASYNKSIELLKEQNKLNKEILQNEQDSIQVSLQKLQAQKDLGAQLAEQAINAIEGKVADQESAKAIIDSLRAGESYADVVKRITELKENGKIKDDDTKALLNEIINLGVEQNNGIEQTALEEQGVIDALKEQLELRKRIRDESFGPGEKLEGGFRASEMIAVEFAQNENDSKLAIAKRNAAREAANRKPMGSVERASLGLQGLRDQADENSLENQAAQRKIREGMVKSLNLQKKLTKEKKAELESLLQSVDSNTNLEELQSKLAEIAPSLTDNAAEATIEAAKQQAILDKNIEGSKNLLGVEEDRVEAAAKANIGLAKYSSDTEQKLIDQAEDMPRVLAQNIEQSMANTFDKLATGAYDSIGDAFLGIALDFGRELQRQIMQRAAANLTNSLFGSGTTGGGFLNSISSAITGKNAGGLITGGSGVRDDVPAVLTGGEYVMKKSAVQKYGVGFMSSLNSGAMRGYQSGGYVQGADNVRNTKFWADTRGNMVGGKLYEERLAKARGKDFFVPGTRGAGAIVGKENLLAFSQQQFTSGATDVISSRAGGASLNLEDQSVRLTAFGRRRSSPARQALEDAQRQAFDLYQAQVAEENRVVEEKRAAKKARTKAFQQAIVGSFVNATIAGVSTGLQNMGAPKIESTSAFQASSNQYTSQALGGYNVGPTSPGTSVNFGGGISVPTNLQAAPNPSFDLGAGQTFKPMFNYANGGLFSGGGSGGANSMLMGGEYVVDSATASTIGGDTLDSINMGNFANGGFVGGSSNSGGYSSSADVGEVNITINIEKDGKSSVSTSGSGEEDPTKAKEFSKKVKDVVLNVINEEKRVSGTLFTRNK